MDSLFREFGDALQSRDGYRLSRTLSPDITDNQLQAIFKSCNAHDVKRVLKAGLEDACQDRDQLPFDEINAWAEVYFCYWKTAGELLAIRGSPTLNGRVSKLILMQSQMGTANLFFPVFPVHMGQDI